MRVMAPWGQEQFLRKGSYLNVTDLSNIYGVAEQEFLDTYTLATLPDRGPQWMWDSNSLAPYVEQGFFGPAQTYAKFARIQATQAQGGEAIETVLADGTKETANIANAGDWIVTNPGGEQYIVSAEQFAKKYEPAPELGEGWFKPKGKPQQFVQIQQDLTFVAPWGKEQFLRKGSYLNVTDLSNIYGVAEEEFLATYKLVK